MSGLEHKSSLHLSFSPEVYTPLEQQLSTDRYHISLGHLFNKKRAFLKSFPASNTKTAFLSLPIRGLNTSLEHHLGTNRHHISLGHLFNLKKEEFFTPPLYALFLIVSNVVLSVALTSFVINSFAAA